MKKEEAVKSLLDFADYMVEVEDDFAKINEAGKEVRRKSFSANSVWTYLLSFLSKLSFIYTILSIWSLILCGIKNIQNMSELESIAMKILNPFPLAFIVSFLLGSLWFYFFINESKRNVSAENKYLKAKSEMEDIYSKIIEQYNGYENPPVSIEYSNPYFLLDVVEILENSKTEIPLSEAIAIAEKNN